MVLGSVGSHFGEGFDLPEFTHWGSNALFTGAFHLFLWWFMLMNHYSQENWLSKYNWKLSDHIVSVQRKVGMGKNWTAIWYKLVFGERNSWEVVLDFCHIKFLMLRQYFTSQLSVSGPWAGSYGEKMCDSAYLLSPYHSLSLILISFLLPLASWRPQCPPLFPTLPLQPFLLSYTLRPVWFFYLWSTFCILLALLTVLN